MLGNFSKTHLLGKNSIFLVNEYLFNFCCPIIIYKSYRVESLQSICACTYFMNTDQQSGKFKFISDVSGKKWLMYVRTKKFAVG